jgi:hypothetical protein
VAIATGQQLKDGAALWRDAEPLPAEQGDESIGGLHGHSLFDMAPYRQ